MEIRSSDLPVRKMRNEPDTETAQYRRSHRLLCTVLAGIAGDAEICEEIRSSPIAFLFPMVVGSFVIPFSIVEFSGTFQIFLFQSFILVLVRCIDGHYSNSLNHAPRIVHGNKGTIPIIPLMFKSFPKELNQLDLLINHFD